MNSDMAVKVDRALLTVADKSGIAEFGRELEALGIEIIATRGTARELRLAKIAVQEVSQVTGFPETLDGRLKTLHPTIHGSILARRTPRHQRQLRNLSLSPIGLVVVTLKPFEEIIQKPGITPQEAMEQIDVGGGALLRAAAKNFEAVTVICDPADYEEVLQALIPRRQIPDALRAWLALKAIRFSAQYEVLVAEYLDQVLKPMIKTRRHILPVDIGRDGEALF